MNKHVLRTSLVWLAIVAVLIGVFVYRSELLSAHFRRSDASAASASTQMQPEVAGPPASAATPAPAATSDSMAASLAPLQLTPERMQSIGVQTAEVQYKQVNDDIRATGNVDIDERLISYVQVRFPGYIRKVFANASYQYVRKGEPLFTVYSPDLVATQQEFLLARQDQRRLATSTVDGVAAGAEALTTAAEQRLQQWEVPQSELDALKASGKPITDLTIDSPVTGYITDRNALPNMYVQPSTRLYTIADLSRVWVYAQVFQDDVGRLKPGDTAQITVDSYPGRVFAAHIDDILPQVDLSSRTVRVRLALANPGLKLKPGMFVNVDLKATMGRALTVPASAVIESGTRQIVFIYEGDGKLEPKEVTVGAISGKDLVVLSGLKEHQKVVTSADFLIDSESQLQAAAGAFNPPAPVAGATTAPMKLQATIDLTTDPNPAQSGNNTLRVKVTDANGAPVAGAQVTVKFYMPAMAAMGMAAMDMTTKLSDKGSGLYEGSGKLNSGGTWQVTVTVQKSGQTIATRQLRITAAGGM